jgi:hypothetical protein
MRPSAPRRRLLSTLAITALTASLALPGPAAAGVATYQFTIGLGATCINGHGPNNTDIALTLRNSQGVLKSTGTATSDASGYWYMNSCFSQPVEAGDSVRATGGGVSRTWVVQPLTARGNRTSDVVNGRAKPGSNVTIYAYQCPTGYGSCFQALSVGVPVDGGGAYSFDLSGTFDAKGQDYVSVQWTGPSGDVLWAYRTFAYVTVWYGESRWFAQGNPLQVVNVTLKTAADAVRGTGSAMGGTSGYMSGDLRQGNGSPVYVNGGNKVSTNLGSTFTVASMTLVGAASTDRVSGTCAPNRYFIIYAYDPDYSRPNPYSYASGMTNASGEFNKDMSSVTYPDFNLMSGDYIEVRCKTNAGDEIALRGNVP